MKNNLAIIIPAYKPDYLSETLSSLAAQTNKNFTVYIGDDASPFDLHAIVSQFTDILQIQYHKFSENLGAKSLVKQWERCIERSEEKWIWLFSDDDVCEANCVEVFYKTVSANTGEFFKFNTQMIDANGKRIKLFNDKTNKEKKSLSPETFITARLRQDRFRSYVVEYIFSRELYQKFHFVDFPLAWFSDDATWLQYAIQNKKIAILPATVYWRFSGKNISSEVNDSHTVLKKMDATKQYVSWLQEIRTHDGLKIQDSDLVFAIVSQLKNFGKEANVDEVISFAQTAELNLDPKTVQNVIHQANQHKVLKLLKSFLN